MIYDKTMHEARKYWRERLGTMSFAAHVALDHPRPRDGQSRRSSLELVLDADAHSRLQRVTSGNPFLSCTVLMLAVKIGCYKYSGDPGVTIFAASTDGTTANLLPVSTTLEPSSSFKDALLALKDCLSSAYRFQQYPCSRMLADLPDDRRPSHLAMAVTMTGFTGELPDGHYDIAIGFDAGAACTKLTFRFDERLYEASTIRGFFGAVTGILRHGLEDMATRIADLMPDHGDASAGGPGSAPGAPGDADLARADAVWIHRLIEAHAANHPDRAAVVQSGRVTTYRALDRHASRLAEVLAGLGLDVRRPVVLLMDAGTEMVASMLGVLKIGAAFAPLKLLSSTAPLTRIVQALGPECIICQRGQLADLQRTEDGAAGVAHILTVEISAASAGDGDQDAGSLDIASHPGPGRPAPGDSGWDPAGDSAAGSDPVCVIVDGRDGDVSTSVLGHAELQRVFQWLAVRCGIDGGDRCLLSPGLGVCGHLCDTLGMLVAGASVELAGAEILRDTALLAERLMAPEITLWDLSTPLLQNLLPDLLARHPERDHLPGPRNILLTGEKQCVRLADRLARRFPRARITGLYAHPTLGVWSTVFPLGDRAAPQRGTAVAQPILGFEHRVVNRAGQPAPVGTTGELRLRRRPPAPDLDAAAGQDLATGLRARSLAHDDVSWLGGEEHCFVKYECRVELTEIEATLCEHERILAAEVIAVKPDPDSDHLVVAFIVADSDQLPAEAARDFLAVRGNVDLIPDRFIRLDEFPLTADGAIDRGALTARLASARDARGDAHGPELVEIHERLKRIWLEILQIDQVNDDDSFFAHGGNSLRATLLLARIKEEFAVELSVQKFFREPSPRAIARLIAAEAKTSSGRQAASEFKVVPRERYRAQLPDLER